MVSLQQEFSELSEDRLQEEAEDLEKLRGTTRRMRNKMKSTARSLRKAADKLDEVWYDCKMAHAAGTSAGIVGGVLTIGGGIATIMTARIATPLLLAGMGFEVAGAAINLGTSYVEASINSTEIRKAEKEMKETLDNVKTVKNTVQLWLDRKEKASLLLICCLAMHTLELTDPVLKFLKAVALRLLNIPPMIVRECMALGAGQAFAQTTGQTCPQGAIQLGAQAADDVAQTGAKAGVQTGSKLTGGMIIGISAAFLVLDVIDLGYTISDLIKEKGSKAAKLLREKADELDKLC